jgi:hypothetical protein
VADQDLHHKYRSSLKPFIMGGGGVVMQITPQSKRWCRWRNYYNKCGNTTGTGSILANGGNGARSFGGVHLTVQVVAVQEEVYFKRNKFKYSSNHSS